MPQLRLALQEVLALDQNAAMLAHAFLAHRVGTLGSFCPAWKDRICRKMSILTGWGVEGLLTLVLPLCSAQSSCPEVTLPVGMCGCPGEATGS